MGHAQALPLAHGVAPITQVSTQQATIKVANFTFPPLGISPLGLQEGVIAVLSHEADLLAFGLLGQVEPEFLSHLAHLEFGEVGEGEEAAGQGGLGVVEEEVALVLGGISGLQQVLESLGLGDGGVVTRSHKGGLE